MQPATQVKSVSYLLQDGKRLPAKCVDAL